jgi:hypothetical protein
MFPTLKMGRKGTHFVTMEDIKCSVTAELRKIPNEASVGTADSGRIGAASAHAQGPCFRGDYVSIAICPTITVQYHRYGNFLTAHRITERSYDTIQYSESLGLGALSIFRNYK